MVPEPEILVPVRVDGRFRIKELIDSGTYGHVHRAVNIFTNKSYAIKLELSIDEGSSVEHEYAILQTLGGGNGIPHIHWFGREANYNVLVLDLLGPSLHERMNKHKKFHIHTVVHIADQLISRLQYIHDHDFIHGDIKPQNILVGFGDNAHTIFIVDFGSAKRYRDASTGSHVPFLHTHRLTGTPAFTSINSHLGAQPGRRDDIELLVYLLVYFLRGSLPWLASNCEDSKSASILELKRKTSVEQLCCGLPWEIAAFSTYSRTLSFSEEPDYDYLCSLLLPLCTQLSGSPDIALDLCVNPQMDYLKHASLGFFPAQPHTQSPPVEPAPTPFAKVVRAKPVPLTTANLRRHKWSTGMLQSPQKELSPRT